MQIVIDTVNAVSRAVMGASTFVTDASAHIAGAGKDACETFNALVEASMEVTDAVALVVVEAASKVGIKLSQHSVADGIAFLTPLAMGAAGVVAGVTVGRKLAQRR